MTTLSSSISTPLETTPATSANINDLVISRAYAGNDFLLFITDKLNNNSHKHPAIQLNISLSGETISVNDGNNIFIGHNLLIDSNHSHEIRSHCRWQAVLLLATHSAIARHLQLSQLQNKTFIAQLPEDKNQALKKSLLNLATTDPEQSLIPTRLAEVFYALHAIATSSAPAVDPRLKKVLRHLYQSNESTVSHIKLAKSMAISSSHLSRFFRKETGGTLRNFKLWQRTLNGTNLMLQGKSITEASIEAGFADTAHFSRSFKRQLGISASALKQHAREVFCFDSDSDALLASANKERRQDEQ